MEQAEEAEFYKMKNLWKAVLMRTAKDLINNNKKYRIHKKRAIAWFNQKNLEFKLVCLYAGYDPDYIFRKTEEIRLENAIQPLQSA